MHTESYIHHGHTVYEHRLQVPLDHLRPAGEDNPTIEVFAREVVRKGREDSPYAVFLQGGPGYPSPRFGTFTGGWMNRLLQDYRVVLLDQRGTGQSTRMDAQALSHLGTDEEKAAYLRHFRQDQIVYDAEALRRELCGDDPWTTLGQSFGGFITTSYLSLAPQGLKASLITGGLPGLVHVDDIYRLTYERTAARNRAYFQRHPGDERTVRELCAHLADTEETLPTGERLSPARLRMIGMMLGGQGNTDQLHYLLEGPWTSVRGERRLSSQFLAAIGSQVDVAPIYGLFQEYIYACATPDLVGTATGWAADRLAEEVPGFAKDADPLDDKEPFYLTGEHFMRRVFDEDPGLAPLKGVAEILASTTEAAPVYLPDVLAQNTVPVAAAVYYDDMFVPRELSLDTGDLIGARHYITNEYQHDGSAYSGGAVVSHLLDLLAD